MIFFLRTFRNHPIMGNKQSINVLTPYKNTANSCLEECMFGVLPEEYIVKNFRKFDESLKRLVCKYQTINDYTLDKISKYLSKECLEILLVNGYLTENFIVKNIHKFGCNCICLLCETRDLQPNLLKKIDLFHAENKQLCVQCLEIFSKLDFFDAKTKVRLQRKISDILMDD